VTKPVSRKKPASAPVVKPAKPRQPNTDVELNDAPQLWAALVRYGEAEAFTISEFCRRHRISVQLFYKMRDQMPATFNVGTRVLISKEAAARWRAEREQASPSTTACNRSVVPV